MIFDRVKSLDAILATAEKKGLHRSLGAFQLTMLGIGAVIGTGIFVLTSEAAQKAGPGMLLSFVVAGFVCAVAALCYSELASMVPVSGSAYTYTYAVTGELLAWMVGWALILEYAVGASAVAVGWSNHFVGLLTGLGVHVPAAISNADALMAHVAVAFGATPNADLTTAMATGGWINFPAVVIVGLVTWLLVIGTTESARANAVLVAIKITALTAFIILTIPVLKSSNFNPLIPTGTAGVFGAAASIFFAYVGFDAVSTAAEETKNPQRNVPIGLIASLGVCTIFYLLVATGAIGAIGAQPVMSGGIPLSPGSPELAGRCASIVASGTLEPLVCSKEALVHVLTSIGWPAIGRLVGLAAVLALPSVVLMMMFGQTRVFFTMARDGLLPAKLASVHPKFRTPHVVTVVTGIGAALASAVLPVGKLADYSNSGTLFAFFMVAVSVMVLRKTDPSRRRPFRTPAVYIIAPLAIIGCLGLYFSLPLTAILVLPGWGAIGLIVYFLYSRSRSHVGLGITEVVSDDDLAPLPPGSI
ncbi:MAG: amino acid permease [Pseudomonadota bacterium]|jgi:APA family basic amino acid/polyamine antiporter|uniref:amino acid permease n=1 Tax=unclassified Sphingomonas TaxID=196159 RepID=UPI00053F1BB0|nr:MULTISPECIES: amino acid permease [unclassified Sphingomonas]MDR6848526.1 APA family basic amino acid/polyamine antiporter [Sphingomonas sp. BE137]